MAGQGHCPVRALLQGSDFFYHDLLRDAWQAGLAMCDHALEAKMSSISSCHSGARDQSSCGVLPADGEGSHVFAVDGR